MANAAAPMMQMMQVNCPPGSAPGSMVQVQAPNGQQMQVQVPAGVGPGMPFQVQVPAAAPAATPMAMPVAQQPMAQQPMAQQPMMQQPMMMQQQPMQMMSGSDYRMLAGFGDLFIKQQIEMLEAFTGFETENRYDIFGQGGTQHLFHAAEQSDCCSRQFCGPSREFTMTVFGPQGPSAPMITIKRPLKCRSPFCCNLQEVSVYAGTESGQLLGVIREQWSCGDAQLDLEVNGRVEFKIQGPLCVCDGACCGDQVFHIHDPSGQPIQTPGGSAEIRKMGAKDFGSMIQQVSKRNETKCALSQFSFRCRYVKRWFTKTGSGQTCKEDSSKKRLFVSFTQEFTKADNFGATFPMTASPEAKALILASVFLIDFMFFENAQDNNQHHGSDWD
jgi:hypothetical protein